MSRTGIGKKLTARDVSRTVTKTELNRFRSYVLVILVLLVIRDIPGNPLARAFGLLVSHHLTVPREGYWAESVNFLTQAQAQRLLLTCDISQFARRLGWVD